MRALTRWLANTFAGVCDRLAKLLQRCIVVLKYTRLRTIEWVTPMAGNTREAFLRNVRRGVICPSCGSRLSLSEQGSYRAILNESARTSASYLVEAQRHLYAFWDDLLNEHNFPPESAALPSPLLDRDDQQRYTKDSKYLRLQEDTVKDGDGVELHYSYRVSYDSRNGGEHHDPEGVPKYRSVRDGASHTRGSLIFSALLKHSRVFLFEEAARRIPEHRNMYAGEHCIFQSQVTESGAFIASGVPEELALLTDFLTSLNDSHVCSPIVAVVFSQEKVAEWRHATARRVNERISQLATTNPAPQQSEQDGEPGAIPEPASTEQGTRYPEHAVLTGILETEKLLPRKYRMLVDYLAVAESLIRTNENELRALRLTNDRKLVPGPPAPEESAYAVLIGIVEHVLYGLAILGEHKTPRGKSFVRELQVVDLPRENEEDESNTQDQVGLDEAFAVGVFSDESNTQDQVAPSSLFKLPRFVELSHRQLDRLVRWAPGLYLNAFNLPTDVYKRFLEDCDNFTSITDTQELREQDQYFEDSLAALVDFRCQGPPATLFSFQCDESGGDSGAIFCSPVCGWFPRDEETHAIVLFGSPGCGKSNTVIAAMSTLVTHMVSLGVNFWVHFGIDSTQRSRMHKFFQSGKMPDPTPAEHRHVIEIKAQHAETKRNQYFLFLDTPGELAVRGRTITQGEHELVLSTIRNAEYLCFFYDLTLDYPFRQMFSRNTGVWDHVNTTTEKVVRDRVNGDPIAVDVANNPFDYEKSRANFEQMELLCHFLDLVHKQRQDLPKRKDESKQDGTPKCIVVIPKSDLFADLEVDAFDEHRGDDARDQCPYFFDSFYRFIADSGLLEPGLDENGKYSSKLAHACTNGPQFAGIPLEGSDARILETQQLLRAISNQAKTSLQDVQHISRPLSNGEAPGGHSLPRLTDHINGMISGFESTFGADNVWFLPVSSRGNHGSGGDGAPALPPERRLSMEAPPQKLSEFLFLIPLVEAFSQSESTSTPATPPTEPDTGPDTSTEQPQGKLPKKRR